MNVAWEIERKIMIAYQRIDGRTQADAESNCEDPDSELVVRAQAGIAMPSDSLCSSTRRAFPELSSG